MVNWQSEVVTLYKNQYDTIRSLFCVCASPKCTRRELTYVYYSPTRNELCATDGHIMRLEPVDLGDNELYFNREHFSASEISMSDMYPEWTGGKCARKIPVFWEDGLEYPMYWLKIPPIDRQRVENAPAISINFEQAARISSSLPKDRQKILLVPGSGGDTIALYESSDNAIGIILIGLIAAVPNSIIKERLMAFKEGHE